MKIRVSHYQKSGKELFWNGGTLHIKNSKIILKNFFKTVAVFDIDKVKIKNLPDEISYKTVEISDGEKEYILLFTKSNYRKFHENLKSR